MRQVLVSFQAVVQRREDRADWPGVHTAVGVPADRSIDGACIQACAAANAKQTLAQRTAEDFRPAVIEQHQMELLRTFDLTRPPRAGDQRRVDRELLPGGGPSEDL